jgi:Putative MetA-pathway of phenol degradation
MMLAVAAACLAAPAAAEDKDPRPAAGVQDNSFLIEEAYNQEAGVVQHIMNLYRFRREWFFNFTQEWPMGGQDNQFSYGVPYSWIRGDMGQRVHGIGDVQLNYRRQVLYETASMPAFAPRLSLLLPTGSQSKGLGEGSAGIDVLLPFSKIVSDRVTLHANARMRHLFDVDGHHPTNFLLGGSAIYAVTRDFNLMLETLGEWEQSVNSSRELERDFTFIISPGARYAMNFPDTADLQVVLGFATPISFSRSNDKPDFGLFFYLSFEHNFVPKKK